jgi:hypothetical protein
LLPDCVVDPHKAFEADVVEEGAPVTNWDDPQTAAFDQVADVFQTAVGLSLR